jgi:hypothetical protein
MRSEALQVGLAGNKALNKIAIDDFAPREDEMNKSNKANQGNKKNKKTKSMKSSHTGDLLDERDKQDQEADEALELRKKENKQDSVAQHKEEQSALKKEIEQLVKEDTPA